MTANDKKRYTAPQLTAVVIDREITLVMTSPGEFPGLAPSQQGMLNKEKNASERAASPFGTDRPNYNSRR